MTPTDTIPPTPAVEDGSEPDPNSGGSRLGRFLAVAVVLGMVIFWAVAIAMDGRVKVKGRLDDHTFPQAAEPICAAAQADIKRLPQAHEAKDPLQRAEVIDTATRRLETMLADLRKVVPATADAKWINMWIDDWGTHIRDRNDFTARLRTEGASAEFFESEKAGTQISRSLNNYAEINYMESCGLPGDV